ncbi:MAG TPA: response regulator [Polyangiaceae bacterium]|jgi:CheY-like chemotaxis protein|nr:response regulator [Polyangiaceae bacterium]
MPARVLLIDDDEIAREFLASLLRDGGHQVFELPSPIGATRSILNNAIEVVILDVFMPQMDGDKSAKMLRENPRLAGLIIVLISSCEPTQLEEIARRVRADAVVSKAEARLKLVPTVNQLRRASGRPGPIERLTAPREPGKLG